jgi:diacylglycerol kinase (ATP)
MQERPGNAFDNVQKHRRGLVRIGHATAYSWRGLQAAWDEAAFRQEALLAIILLPAAWWLGQSWPERAVLAGTIVLVLIVELLNTAVEAAIDRIGPENHALSARAKDLGSAAVLLSLLFSLSVWGSALWSRFGPT